MEKRLQKQISARKLTILLLLAAPDMNNQIAQTILGTTRMQKLVFLVSERIGIALKNSTYFSFDFKYEAEKFGPADLDLYQDLDFLKTMWLITCDGNGAPEPSFEPSLDTIFEQPSMKKPMMLPEEKEEAELSFEYLMGVEPSELLTADVETESESEYAITEKGLKLIENLENSSEGREKELFEALENACTAIRQEYASWNLRRLLKYIYNNYSSLTTKSIIRDKIMGSR